MESLDFERAGSAKVAGKSGSAGTRARVIVWVSTPQNRGGLQDCQLLEVIQFTQDVIPGEHDGAQRVGKNRGRSGKDIDGQASWDGGRY